MSDIVTTQVFSNGETGITATKLNNIVGQAAIQTSFVSGQPLASSIGTTDQFLLLTSGGTYARVPQSTLLPSVSGSLTPAGVGQAGIMNALSGKTTDYVSGANTCIDLASAPAITGMRLRSFNSVNNANFEVDQRNVNNPLTYAAGNVAQNQCDRWLIQKNAATGVMGAQAVSQVFPSSILLPGTSFNISRSYLGFSVLTAQASLAAGEYINIVQIVEGPNFRELALDVHSLSILCWSQNALNFAVSLRDPGSTTRSLVMPCSLAAGTLTLITLPNLPIWSTSGAFSYAPGSQGYILTICLGCGVTYQTGTTGSWVNGNFLGYAGMSNFLSSTSNQFQLRFVQHEPGPNCTTPMDLDFPTNLIRCQRMFQKTYTYETPVGNTGPAGLIAFIAPAAGTIAHGPLRFHQSMAKAPTVTLYNYGTGAANSVRDAAGTDHASAAASNVGANGFSGITYTTATAAANGVYAHYTADTGW